jgi:putative zinc finger protein
MIKRCENIRDRIGAWMDGELSRSSAEEVRVHLENCLACREERRQLEKLQASLKEVLVARPPNVSFERFWFGVEQRINRKRVWHEDFFGWVHDLLTPPQLAWLVPAVIILVLTGVFSFESFFPGSRLAVQRNNFAAVDSIDGFGRNVAVLREDDTKTTIIWLYQNQEGEDESTAEKSESSPSF